MAGNHPFPGFHGFSYQEAIPYEKGVTRRDPSPVIRAEGLYHVWYSRSTHDEGGYWATIWHATSTDGLIWEEREAALGAGSTGSFDEHAVFTPTIMVAKQRYWLFYTGVPEPFTNDRGGPEGTKTAIGLASSESPFGPWKRVGTEPVLRTAENPSAFDSHRVDDACLIRVGDEYRLYYKGRQLGLTPRDTKMGLAITHRPEGPYVRHPKNPVLDSGHEVCVWPHGTGVGCMVAPNGPQGSTLQYSQDGIVFQRVSSVDPPRAPGPYREDHWLTGRAPGIHWGLCHDITSRRDWPWLLRFDCDLRTGSER